MSSDSNPKAELDPTLDFIAGTIAGSAALAVGFPFDTVKVRFQNPGVTARYHTTFNALATIVRQEGIRAWYRGISSPLLTTAPLNGLIFASYRLFMKLQLDNPNNDPTLAQVALAGAGSGIVASVITTPTDLIKIHQQSQVVASGSVRPLSAVQVALGIIKESGWRGLYRGITSTALRDIGYGAYFAAYEGTLLFFTPPKPAPHDHSNLMSEADTSIAAHPWPILLLAGGVAGVVGWFATFPLDVVKTRVQSSSGSDPSNPYKSTWSTITHSYRNEGFAVFFRGLAPTLIRAIPVNMVTFATFETIVHAFA